MANTNAWSLQNNGRKCGRNVNFYARYLLLTIIIII